MENEVKLAVALHGHLSPGVALGIRMGRIGLKKLGLPKGDKRLFAVIETSTCLADGIQVSTGCTPGRVSLRVEDFGKLAVCMARSDIREGVRLSPKLELLPPLISDWIMRKRRFNQENEEKVAGEILGLDEAFFNIERVYIEPFSESEEAEVVKCSICGELVVKTKTIEADGRTLCKPCHGARYYKPLKSSGK